MVKWISQIFGSTYESWRNKACLLLQWDGPLLTLRNIHSASSMVVSAHITQQETDLFKAFNWLSSFFNVLCILVVFRYWLKALRQYVWSVLSKWKFFQMFSQDEHVLAASCRVFEKPMIFFRTDKAFCTESLKSPWHGFNKCLYWKKYVKANK